MSIDMLGAEVNLWRLVFEYVLYLWPFMFYVFCTCSTWKPQLLTISNNWGHVWTSLSTACLVIYIRFTLALDDVNQLSTNPWAPAPSSHDKDILTCCWQPAVYPVTSQRQRVRQADKLLTVQLTSASNIISLQLTEEDSSLELSQPLHTELTSELHTLSVYNSITTQCKCDHTEVCSGETGNSMKCIDGAGVSSMQTKDKNYYLPHTDIHRCLFIGF